MSKITNLHRISSIALALAVLAFGHANDTRPMLPTAKQPWPPSPNPFSPPPASASRGLRFTDPRAQALLTALCVFRLLPNGFTNRDLRNHLAPLLGKPIQAMTSGQTTYDLRRLRAHALIERIPKTFRY
jgi:hypothetical protein